VVLELHPHFLELLLHMAVAVLDDQLLTTEPRQQEAVQVMEHVPVRPTLVAVAQIVYRQLLEELAEAPEVAEL
jgi:hypothetical protein